MIVAELIARLQALPQDAVIVQSCDAEGNGYSATRVVDIGRFDAYSGDFGLDRLTDEDRAAGYSEGDVVDGPLAVCLWP